MPRQGGKSKDSVQQHLRDHKRTWSDNASDLIAKLIAFKRGLNGRGDAQAGLPPSTIKEALPAEIGSFLDQLASQFQGLVNDAGSIMDEQAHYAKVRRRKRPKSNTPTAAPTPEPTAETPAPAEPNLVDTLSRLGAPNPQLTIEASSRLSRLWQYTKGLFSRKEYNKHRIGMLSMSADLYYKFLDFENDILSIKINSIPAAIRTYQGARYSFKELKDTLTNVIEIMEHKAQTSAKQPEKQLPKVPLISPKPVVPPNRDVGKIKQDIHLVSNAGFGTSAALALNELIMEYEQEDDPTMKNMLHERIVHNYDQFVKSVLVEIQKKYGPTQINSLQDIINLIRKNKPAANDFANNQIVKFAHNAITRYLKKQLVKALGHNKTAAQRLEIAEVVEDTKALLKRMMDALETELDPEVLLGFVKELDENMERINRPLSILGTMYKAEYFKTEKRRKKLKGPLKGPQQTPDMDEDEFMNYLLKRKVRRDVERDIF